MAELADVPKPGTVEHYLKHRLDHQISHFETAATREQRRGKSWQNVTIVAAALTPLLIGWAEIATDDESKSGLRILALASSGAAAIATSIISVRRYWETGVLYRAREEALKGERWLWQQKVGPYDAAMASADAPVDPDKLLVERAEAIIAEDVSEWTKRMREASQRADTGGG